MATDLFIPVKLAGIFGILSPVVVFTTFVVSIYLHPWFKWKKHALSDLGALGTKRSFVLNLGLVILGVTFLLFTTRANLLVNSRAGLVGVRLLPLLAFGPILVALFPWGNKLHIPACFAPYILVVIIMVLIGIDYFQSSDYIRGAVTFLILFVCVVFALLPLLHNVLYKSSVIRKIAVIKFPSQSIPELISAIFLSLWFIMFVSRIFTIADN